MSVDQAKLNEILALIGGPTKGSNDQGSFELDLVQQLEALKKIASLQSTVTSASNRGALFGSMANKFKPPGIT